MTLLKKLLTYSTFSILIWYFPGILSAQEYFFFTNEMTRLEVFENFQVRNKYREIIFSSFYQAVNAKQRIHIQDDFQHRVQFSLVKKDNALFFLFLNERESGFPMIGRGNISIKRSLENGKILQMTIMVRDHRKCYLRLTPYDKRTALDLYLFGTHVYHDIFLPLPINSLIFEPFATIVELTGNIIDWDVILYKALEGESREGIEIFNKIRKMLPLLHTVEDGAMSAKGEYVFIENLNPQPGPGGFNCSGFAKWIVDGLYFCLKGEYTDITVLKEKHLEYRGNRWSRWYEDERDPYFGLDWTRNLALELFRAQTKKNITDPESFDIRDIRFLEYIEDAGYAITDLEFIFFFLAGENPDCIYLGSVNQTIGKEPALRQYYHVAVFFPYFDDQGRLQVIVMEKNKEVDLSFFMSEYDNNYIHLVRISIEGKFQPPAP
ncbi:MAG: hypothetical protein JXB88_11225 [Spirochaetales bacterium]|nr:hypothetical protein [Spirochaetales bacterium]